MDEEDKQYSWEVDYERTWEGITESADGGLQASDDDMLYKIKKRKTCGGSGKIKLGVMRHVYLVIDSSRSMEDKDLRPNRFIATLKMVERFVTDFFDQNPLSQLGVIATRNARAEKVSEMGCNPSKHVSLLEQMCSWACQGEPSLQNAMEMALRGLVNAPTHSSKEVVIVMGALTSSDPGNMQETMQKLEASSVRCSVIGLAAEVRLCKTLAQKTDGSYSVILNETHFKDLLLTHVRPPAAKATAESSLIRMGFPQHVMQASPSFCVCHLNRSSARMTRTGYFCSQCHSKYCELPVECIICGLTLVLAPHLSRSNHHLFPVPSFNPTECSSGVCTSCRTSVSSEGYCCPRCESLYCIDCDIFIHETLHYCPGCMQQ